MLFENINIYLNDGSILHNTCLLTKGDSIIYIGKKPPTEEKPEIFDGKNKLILPGFINTHCHVPMTLMRSIGENLSLNDWLNSAIFPIEEKLTDEYVYWGTKLGIAEMIASGITSFSDMYYFSDSIAKAVAETKINANLSLEGAAFNIENKFTIPINKVVDFHEKFNNYDNGRIKVDICIHSEYTCSEAKIKKLSDLSKSLNSNIQLHLSETENETLASIKRNKKTPTEFFNDIGVFDSKTTAAHCVYMTDADLDIIKNKNVSVSHCPMSNLKLGSGIADIKKMIDRGISVSIGTDGVASNDNFNFIEELKMASLLQKGIHKDPSSVNTIDIINMSTKNGALAQSRFNTGEIKVGNKADLIVVDFNSVNLTPSYNFTNTFIYAGDKSNICLTMANGKVLYLNGDYKTLDIENIKYEVDRIKSIFNYK